MAAALEASSASASSSTLVASSSSSTAAPDADLPSSTTAGVHEHVPAIVTSTVAPAPTKRAKKQHPASAASSPRSRPSSARASRIGSLATAASMGAADEDGDANTPSYLRETTAHKLKAGKVRRTISSNHAAHDCCGMSGFSSYPHTYTPDVVGTLAWCLLAHMQQCTSVQCCNHVTLYK